MEENKKMYDLGLENGYGNIPPMYQNNNYYMQGFYEGQAHYMEALRRYQEEIEYHKNNFNKILTNKF